MSTTPQDMPSRGEGELLGLPDAATWERLRHKADPPKALVAARKFIVEAGRMALESGVDEAAKAERRGGPERQKRPGGPKPGFTSPMKGRHFHRWQKDGRCAWCDLEMRTTGSGTKYLRDGAVVAEGDGRLPLCAPLNPQSEPPPPEPETPQRMLDRAHEMVSCKPFSDNERAALRLVLRLADSACDAAQEVQTPEQYQAFLTANADAARAGP